MEGNTTNKITINEKEYDFPEGIMPLGNDGLYLIAWNLLEIAKEISSEEKFRFFNPRHLGKYEVSETEIFLGQGFGKEEMKELMANIVKKGLDYPFLTYSVLDADGKIKVCIYEGERRWRCLQRMIEKDMQVWSRQRKQFLPAKEVYCNVLCRIDCMTEEEALSQACASSETTVKWGDGANARLIKTLYDKGKKDEEICKLLNKSKQWLAETYSLNELDEYCFDFLLSSKINRKVALDLAKIKDVQVRQEWLKNAWANAIETYEKANAKNERLLEKAESQEELTQAEVEEAKTKGESAEVVGTLTEVATAATEKTTKRKQAKAASARPMVKSKNLRNTAGGLFNSALRAPKIKKKLLAVSEMIEKNDTSVVDIKILMALKIAYQCILDGEEDIGNVLKKIA